MYSFQQMNHSLDVPRPVAHLGFIFDLDGTIVDSRSAANDRSSRNWREARAKIPMMPQYRTIIKAINRLVELTYDVAIVTSSPEAYCREILRTCGIDDRQVVLVCYHDTHKHKPAPDPILLAQKRLRHSCDVIFCTGDEQKDYDATCAANQIDSEHTYIPLVAGWCPTEVKITDTVFLTQRDFVEYIGVIINKDQKA